MLAAQVALLEGIGLDAARHRLTALTRAGYLTSEQRYVAEPRAYAVTRDGRGAAGSDLGPAAEARSGPLRPRRRGHLADRRRAPRPVRRALAGACPSGGCDPRTAATAAAATARGPLHRRRRRLGGRRPATALPGPDRRHGLGPAGRVRARAAAEGRRSPRADPVGLRRRSAVRRRRLPGGDARRIGARWRRPRAAPGWRTGSTSSCSAGRATASPARRDGRRAAAFSRPGTRGPERRTREQRARQPMMALTPRRLAGLALFAAALLAPAPWGVLALTAALAGRGVVAAGRFARNRRTRRADPGTIVLGRDHAGRQVALSDRQLEAHALIVGASGAGKTTTLADDPRPADRARATGRRDRHEGLARRSRPSSPPPRAPRVGG